MQSFVNSLKNPYIKQLILIKEKSRARKRSGLFLIEGKREIELALKGDYTIDTILFNDAIISKEVVDTFFEQSEQKPRCIKVSKEVYQRLAYRDKTEGVIAVTKVKTHAINQLKIPNQQSLILIAEAPEKPGNIGALLRTADAANVDAVIIANPITDMYNPNIVRSSVGCVFTNQIGIGSTTEIISFLKSKNIQIFCATLQESVRYDTQDYKQSTAIVVGTESTGLSTEWLNNTTRNIIIPMEGTIDSMNVSVAAGILIFEAKRQRNANNK